MYKKKKRSFQGTLPRHRPSFRRRQPKCESCGKKIEMGRFCYWCGKKKGLW